MYFKVGCHTPTVSGRYKINRGIDRYDGLFFKKRFSLTCKNQHHNFFGVGAGGWGKDNIFGGRARYQLNNWLN